MHTTQICAYVQSYFFNAQVFEGEKKHKKGGLNCVFFSSFSPTEVTVQKQIDFSF